MEPYRQAFIEFALEKGALRFGDFALKSGRRSPYFFNTGQFDSGAALARLGEAYAQAIEASGIGFDMLYGPAYKGIPLVAAVAIGLWRVCARDVPWAFNRKEIKDHGEGGRTVGAPLAGRVLIVDDVISAGTSVRESLDIISAAGARATGVVIALDREERGEGARSAVRELEESFELRCVPVIRLQDLLEYLRARGEDPALVAAMEAYRQRWGETVPPEAAGTGQAGARQ